MEKVENDKCGAMSTTIDVRGQVSVECPNCGNEHEYDIKHFFDQYGFDTAKWGKTWGLQCEKCEYPIDLSDGICVIQSGEQDE